MKEVTNLIIVDFDKSHVESALQIAKANYYEERKEVSCLPEYRGRDIYPNLLNYAIDKLAGEGYKLLGVDFESFNPTAYGFWLKHFTAYTKSVVRRIDECALRAE